MAFDNSPQAFIDGLDSYEFNTRGMVQSMVHHVLAPQNPLYRGQRVLHLKGHVVSRSLHKKLLESPHRHIHRDNAE